MKRMLFNATQAEELRVAIVDGQKLIDLDIESATKEQRKSNIYKGVITRIEPSLEAAFVDYGEERHGFLPFKEVSRAYFKEGVDVSRARIQEALKEGQEVIVQVEKDERGNKGAALTTFVSLAGRYLVLMPNNPRGGGVSRRVEGDERAELREVMDTLEVPGGMSLIARTAAIGRNAEELQWDLNYLLQLWRAIDGAVKDMDGAGLIYQEGSLVIRAIRDYFQPDIGEILIDTDAIFEQASAFMGTVMPANVHRVKRYQDDVPLFSRFQIEHQIESAYSRQVNLPSGGAIVIDHTEALVSVDVNSGRATRGADIEETALRTNLEAADEVARQLRLRDLGGLIVIDFIDMENARNQREVENRLRDALRYDRARVQTGKISRFGLLELSRQRLRPALAETSYIPCPRCTGTGHIRSTESAALHILRILEEEAMKENTGAIHTQVPVDVATFLLNEKRVDIAKIELRHKVNLLIIPNRHLETPQHEIVRLRHDQLNVDEALIPSYRMAAAPAEPAYTPPSAQTEAKPARQEAAIKGITPAQPAPVVAERPAKAQQNGEKAEGFLARIIAWFRGSSAEEIQPEPAPKTRGEGRDGRRRDNERRGNRKDARRSDEARSERAPRPERGDRSERAEARPQTNERPRQEKPEAPKSEAQQAPRQPRERSNKAERGERQPRPDRAEREQQRRERQQAREAANQAAEAEVINEAAQAQATQAAALAPEAVAERPANERPSTEEAREGQGRNRRNRRGRGRGERNHEAAPVQQEEGLVAAQAEPIELAPVQAETAQPEPIATQTVIEAAPIEAQVETPKPVAEAKVEAPAIAAPVVETPVVEAEKPAPVVEVAVAAPVEAPAPTPAPAAPAAPQIDLKALLAAEQAELQMVETVPGSSAPTPAEEAPKPAAPRKRRPRRVAAEAEVELQQVETAPSDTKAD